nr:hypothetical protein [Pseudomonas mendocina]
MHTITNACFQVMTKAFASKGVALARYLPGLDQALAGHEPVRVMLAYRLLSALVSETGDAEMG